MELRNRASLKVLQVILMFSSLKLISFSAPPLPAIGNVGARADWVGLAPLVLLSLAQPASGIRDFSLCFPCGGVLLPAGDLVVI